MDDILKFLNNSTHLLQIVFKIFSYVYDLSDFGLECFSPPASVNTTEDYIFLSKTNVTLPTSNVVKENMHT